MSKLVTFTEDVYPYVRGDVVKLDAATLKAVDESAKRRGIASAYTSGAKDPSETATTEALPEVYRAVSNPLLPEYPQVDDNGQPVLEQLTRAQADAGVAQTAPAPAEAVAKVEEAKEEPAVVTDVEPSEDQPAVEQPAKRTRK